MEEGFSLCLLILISFQFFLATSGILISSSSSQGTAVCSVINCGQGTCKASNDSFLGFDCECNSGWRKLQIGLFTFPYCVLPNGSAENQSAVALLSHQQGWFLSFIPLLNSQTLAGFFGVVMEPAWPMEQLHSHILACIFIYLPLPRRLRS